MRAKIMYVCYITKQNNDKYASDDNDRSEYLKASRGNVHHEVRKHEVGHELD